MMQSVWISGWGIPPEMLRPLGRAHSPEAELVLLAPTAAAAETAAGAEIVVAWSFGAFRVLEAAARGLVFTGRVYLLAPFTAFAAEHGQGGRCALAQLRWLKRWLGRDANDALRDFYSRAGIGGPAEPDPAFVTQWEADLDTLMRDPGPAIRARFAAGLPENFHAAIGGRDPLLDAGVIASLLPGTRIVPEAGHECAPLLAALKGTHAL